MASSSLLLLFIKWKGILNKEDEKKFAISLTQRLNNLDNGIHFLNISAWNKFKANVIHHRYWIDRENDT
jgi:hypothetical protein